jgi:hypothetical protein
VTKQPSWATLRKTLTSKSFIISSVITVVVLVAVILGVAAFGPGNSRTPSSVVVPTESQQLTQDANKAAASGDATSAATLARKAIGLDPTNQAAKNALDQATKQQAAGAKSSVTGSSSSSSAGKTTPDTGFTTRVADINLLLPTSFPDYSMGSPVVSGGDTVESGSPSSSAATAQHLVWAVHDRESGSAARTFITKVSKASYPVNGASVTIDGAPGYYGTDGARYATVAYVRGRYVFEVLGSATGNPEALRATVIKAAQAFPDSPAK